MSITSIVTGTSKSGLDIKNVEGPLCNAIAIVFYDGEKAPKLCKKGSTVRARGHVDADYELPAIQAHTQDIHCTK